jgi:hypothetical protein
VDFLLRQAGLLRCPDTRGQVLKLHGFGTVMQNGIRGSQLAPWGRLRVGHHAQNSIHGGCGAVLQAGDGLAKCFAPCFAVLCLENSGVLLMRHAVVGEMPAAAAAFSKVGFCSKARINCSLG